MEEMVWKAQAWMGGTGGALLMQESTLGIACKLSAARAVDPEEGRL